MNEIWTKIIEDNVISYNAFDGFKARKINKGELEHRKARLEKNINALQSEVAQINSDINIYDQIINGTTVSGVTVN